MRSLRTSVTVVDPVAAVQQVVAAADISYILMVPSASLDTSGRFRYVPELAIITDAVALNVGKTLSSPGVSLEDALTHLTTKGVSDSVSLSEVFLATLVFLRDFADSVDALDAHSIDFSRPLADSFELVENTSSVFTKSLSSGVAMNDSFDLGDGAIYVFTKGVMNVVFAQDAHVKAYNKALADMIAVTDAGVLAIQNYCDITYFAEDYVGESRIFS
jgi:hypothetical protein